ncbi:MAG TPA: TRAP transporter TatT component family protein, partial [Burkholderiales bacterium]|nr:TRAP transporter TatT component family protein [Burkholderiales bacterium]
MQSPARQRTPLIWLLGLALTLPGCSVRQYALTKTADALAESGSAFASDDDPELIRAAAPFSLKAIESVLADNPDHVGLLTAAARGFTQYAYAFVQQEGEAQEATDIARATQTLERARRLYRRGRDYGLRGLQVSHPGLPAQLQRDARAAVAGTTRADVPLLYWTAAAWAALINLSKDVPQIVAEVPSMQALIDRAAELDEAWDAGAIHTFLISYEPARQGAAGDALARSQAHFERALALTEGRQAAPFVALAETVAVS